MAAGEADVEAAELLGLAIASPSEAEVRARELIGATSDPWMLSVARHTLGVVLRDRGRNPDALRELRAARDLARRSGDADRVADVRATLGSALTLNGQTGAGLRELDRSVLDAADPQVRARCRMRRGYVLSVVLGRHREALPDLEAALAGSRAQGDRLWEARTLSTMSLLHVEVGAVDEAAATVTEARRLFVEEGHELEAVQALHSLGTVAYCRGDLPQALDLYDLAAAEYTAWAGAPVELSRDRCQALLAAGLPAEACAVASEHLSRSGVHPVNRAELELYLALGQLARDDLAAALSAARSARDSFRRQGRELSTARAQLLVLAARRTTGSRARALAADAARLAETLEQARSEDAPAAWVLAGRIAADQAREDRGTTGRASQLWSAAARYRHHPSGLVRATAWLAEALDQDRRGDRRGTWRACRRGLTDLDEHRATLGSTELRTLASRRGDELASMALDHAVSAGPRATLWWSERWRAAALDQSVVRPPADPELAKLLAQLRANDRRLSEDRDNADASLTLERERVRLERAIQRRRRHDSGPGRSTTATRGLDVPRLIEELDDRTFVELIEVGGCLHALVVARGRVRKLVVGEAAEAASAVAAAQFVFRQAARGRLKSLTSIGDRLEKSLLGPARSILGPGPVVLSPTAALHGVPWGVLPTLRERPVSVVPSAQLWLRGRDRRPASDRRVLVVGPDLASTGAEVPVLARRYPDAVVLGQGSAEVDAVLRAIEGAALVHVAAHGHFRADNPMFSSLDLDDGPLTVHDFERLEHAPHRLVLSACESGVLAPIGSHELLGLTAALISIGTMGVLASVVPVNDARTAEMMVELHDRLEEHDDLAVAMAQVRSRAGHDATEFATAAAFVPVGG